MARNPKPLRIQDLEAIKVVYSRRRSQFEALLLLLIMTLLVLVPWFQLVEPLGENMKLVKKKFCDGDQDFVVDVNENQQVTNWGERHCLSQAAGMPL